MNNLTKRNLTIAGGILFSLYGAVFTFAFLVNENYLLFPFPFIFMAIGIILISIGFGGLDKDEIV